MSFNELKSDFTWKDLSDIMHEIKSERTVVNSVILLLEEQDNKMKDVEDKLNEIILRVKKE